MKEVTLQITDNAFEAISETAELSGKSIQDVLRNSVYSFVEMWIDLTPDEKKGGMKLRETI